MSGRFVKPEVVVSNFHLRAGDRVADFGAGSGFFTATLAKAVGSEGKVYAIEVQKSLVDTISELARNQNLSNILPIWGDLEEPNESQLNDGEVDVVLLVNTLFQLEDKAAALSEAKRVLRSGGKLFVVDWSESYGGLGPSPEAVLEKVDAETMCESVGFVPERDFDAGDHHYGLAFRKP